MIKRYLTALFLAAALLIAPAADCKLGDKDYTRRVETPATQYLFNDAASPAKDIYGNLPLTVTSGTFNGSNIAITAGSAVASSSQYMNRMRTFTGFVKFKPASTAAFSVDFIGYIDPSYVDAQSYTWYIDPNGAGDGLVFGVTPAGGDGGNFGVQMDTGTLPSFSTSTVYYVMFGYLENGAGTSRAFMYVYKEGDPLGVYDLNYRHDMDSINVTNSSHRLHLTTGTFYRPLKFYPGRYITDVNFFTQLIKDSNR